MVSCYEPCRHCDGTGKILHKCSENSCDTIQELWFRSCNFSHSSEGVFIAQCRICGKLWKIRHQYDGGTGQDDIWLSVGEQHRGYSFTQQEADVALALKSVKPL